MVNVSTHPLVKHKMALLRDANTDPRSFRELVAEVSQFLFYEATADLELSPVTVRTPLGDCPSEVMWQRVGIIPILRAGLGMAEGMLRVLPKACVWHIGMYRDESSRRPVTYYSKLPEQPNIDVGLIVDPMLATGGSASTAAAMLKQWGLKYIKYVGLIAAPEGVTVMQNEHPDVPLYLAAMDSHLNDDAFIVPGLGDAGDRQFGTI